jgi:hypothetical protein
MPMSQRFCEICGQAIDEERAEALPATRLCTEHAHAITKFGGEFSLSFKTEVTSKQGSLKKNYGGVSVAQRRNDRAMRRLEDEHTRQTEITISA